MLTTWCSVHLKDGSGWRCVPDVKTMLDTYVLMQDEGMKSFVGLELVNGSIVNQFFPDISSWVLSTPESREAWMQHLRYCEEEEESFESDDEKWKKGYKE